MESKEGSQVVECIVVYSLALSQVRETKGDLLSLISLYVLTQRLIEKEVKKGKTSIKGERLFLSIGSHGAL